MTPEYIEHHYFSLRVWVIRVVGPAATGLLVALLICNGLSSEKLRGEAAVLIGFAALYYCLLRGGHILMVRSLHKDLLARHEQAYRSQLSGLTPHEIGRNISFTLARIKRGILDDIK